MVRPKRRVPKYRCSFCGKSQEEVRRFIAGQGAVYICDECVKLCMEIVNEENIINAAKPGRENQTPVVSGGQIEPHTPVSNVSIGDSVYRVVTSKRAAAPTQNFLTPNHPLVGVIMGSKSDWETMQHTVETLDKLAVAYEVKVVSAHRTPDLLFQFAASAQSRGLEVIIAGAGGAAHLPGMCAAKTTLPVLGVPIESKTLKGIDSLLSIVQMPAGVPVGTLAIGRAGAINAALLATAILANKYPHFRETLDNFRTEQTQSVLDNPDPRRPEEA